MRPEGTAKVNTFKIVLDGWRAPGYDLNMFKTRMATRSSPKAEVTERRILDAALEMFRTRGFEEATVRDIAAAADVATGAAYYYYPSKDSIVLAFYQRACSEMQPRIEEALAKAPECLLRRLKAVSQVKLGF